MATNLPQSRNRNLPQPPAEPVDVRRRVMTPLPGPEQAKEKQPGLMRHVVAMLIVGGLVFGGIRLYQRALTSDTNRQEILLGVLREMGGKIWESRGFVSLPAETEERRKDLEDLPRIFTAAHAGVQKTKIAPRIMAMEGDPPPGNGNASHQINYYFGDTLGIVLRVRYDGKSESFSFIGVHNRIVPSRSVLIEEGKTPPLAVPSGPKLPGSLLAPPADGVAPEASVPAADSAPPAEKVSEPPANPR